MQTRAKKKTALRKEAKALLARRAHSPSSTPAPRTVPDPQPPPVIVPVLMPGVDEEVSEAGPTARTAAPVEAVDESPPAGETVAPAAAAALKPPDVPAIADIPRPLTQRDDQEVIAAMGWQPRDEARLLLQSPRRLFLYWRFAREARELLREALGTVSERFSPAVRLIDVATGEEGEAATAEGNDYWFDVLPGRLLRAEVGFQGEGLPFVRLLASNTVKTPAVSVSPKEDSEPEFRVGPREFGRVLEATGFAAEERPADPARPDAQEHGGSTDKSVTPARRDAPTRIEAQPSGRATARTSSSPSGGNHFSGVGGGEVF